MNKPDFTLDAAAKALTTCCRRIPHGRVTLTVTRWDGETLGHELHVDHMTETDYDRLMRERPARRGR